MADIVFPDAPGFDPSSQAWKRKIEELLNEVREAQRILRENVASTAEAHGAAIAGVASKATEIEATAALVSDAGLPPVEIVCEPYSYFATNGTPRAGVKVSWSILEATEDANVSDGVAAKYEVWLRAVREADPEPEDGDLPLPAAPEDDSRRVTATPQTYTDLSDLDLGTDYAVKICVVASSGQPGDASAEVLFTTPDEIVGQELAAPDAPMLESAFASVYIPWNGLLGGESAPRHLSSVVAQRLDEGVWVTVGTLVAGSFTDVGREVDAVETYRLVARDRLGRDSAPSDEVTITVIGVEGPNIAANAIIANHIAAGSINVNHVEPAFGDNLDIAANKVIQLTVGNAQAEAAEASSIAKAAGQAAGYASQQAQAAAAAAAEAADGVAKNGATFTFTEDDLRISRPGGISELALSDSSITFWQNGVAVSRWDGGQMIVDKFVGIEVVLANHKIETRGARTLVRSM